MRATTLSLPPGRTWSSGALGGLGRIRRPGKSLPRYAASPWLVMPIVLMATACFCALAEGPLWLQSTPLAAVNLGFALVMVLTGLMLRKEPGQAVPAVALMLTGIFRCVDFIDAWNGAWPVYALVFGGVDRLFGGWALLRYPNPGLSKVQRRYLGGLAIWMIAAARC